MMKINCLLVDDEPLALDALASLIRKIPELVIIDSCSDAVEANVLLPEARPCVSQARTLCRNSLTHRLLKYLKTSYYYM